jgi:hypothetical protein
VQAVRVLEKRSEPPAAHPLAHRERARCAQFSAIERGDPVTAQERR